MKMPAEARPRAILLAALFSPAQAWMLIDLAVSGRARRHVRSRPRAGRDGDHQIVIPTTSFAGSLRDFLAGDLAAKKGPGGHIGEESTEPN